MTPNAASTPFIANPSRGEPVISALTGYPMHPLSANCTKEDWLNDPRFSTEHFKKFGGLEAVAELMRENADEVDMLGIPISLIYYRDFICDRASLVGEEKDEVYSRWAADHPEGVPTFDKVESYMLSAASFAEKLDAMHKANLLDGGGHSTTTGKGTRRRGQTHQKVHGRASAGSIQGRDRPHERRTGRVGQGLQRSSTRDAQCRKGTQRLQKRLCQGRHLH